MENPISPGFIISFSWPTDFFIQFQGLQLYIKLASLFARSKKLRLKGIKIELHNDVCGIINFAFKETVYYLFMVFLTIVLRA